MIDTRNHAHRKTRPSHEARVEEAIRRIREGGMIILTDDEDRENEGDLVCAAAAADERIVAFMAVYGRGLVCQPIPEGTARRLDLRLMVDAAGDHGAGATHLRGGDKQGTAFTVSVDAVAGTTTGISASDRARTIATIMNPGSIPGDLLRPGHMFPLIARSGGVVERPGHTEAAVDLSRLAGLAPGGVICEVLGDDGTPLVGRSLEEMAGRFELPMLSIRELIRYME